MNVNGGSTGFDFNPVQLGLDTATQLFNMDSSHTARNMAHKEFTHKYRYAFDDLRKAGVNPLLAVSGGMSGGGGGVTGGAGQSVNGLGSSAIQGMMMKAQIRKIKAETRQAETASDKNANDAAVASAQSTAIALENYKRQYNADFYRLLIESGYGNVAKGIEEVLKSLPRFSIRGGNKITEHKSIFNTRSTNHYRK
jgi:hypothetical protein